MTHSLRLLLSTLLAVASTFGALSRAAEPLDHASADMPPAPLNEKILKVPVDAAPPVRLLVTLYMPSRGGPFPLVIVNHGAAPDPANAPRVADNFIPYYFLSRGYAVAMPMMRGYAGSEGTMRPHGCDVVSKGLDDAQDIRKVLDYVKRLPGVDASRVIVAGKSMGGWNTLVFGSLAPSDIKGLISFAGGVKESDCHSPDRSLIAGAATLGARTRLPSIWFFGENDRTFSTSTWQAMFRQYTAAGGQAELVDYGVFQQDAHAMTASGAGLPLWIQKADAFLARIGMPGQEVNPEYLPGRASVTSSYANLDDIGALPYLSDKQREQTYRPFLAAPLPRAFAIGLGNASWATGGFDPAAAALSACWKSARYCQLYAVDNTVVWPRQASAPPVTRFAALPDIAAVPYLRTQGRDAYRTFLSSRRPRAFAIAPDGAWGVGSGLDPITDALVTCSNGHQDCRLYAVDGDVVWPAKVTGAPAVASGK